MEIDRALCLQAHKYEEGNQRHLHQGSSLQTAKQPLILAQFQRRWSCTAWENVS